MLINERSDSKRRKSLLFGTILLFADLPMVILYAILILSWRNPNIRKALKNEERNDSWAFFHITILRQVNAVFVLMCWCVDVLMCWCVDVLMCWCVDVLMCWCVDVLMCWCVMCWCVDVLMCYVLMCWCVDVLMTLCWCVDVLMMCWCVDDVLMIVLMIVLMCWCVDVLICWCVDISTSSFNVVVFVFRLWFLELGIADRCILCFHSVFVRLCLSNPNSPGRNMSQG